MSQGGVGCELEMTTGIRDKTHVHGVLLRDSRSYSKTLINIPQTPNVSNQM